jgi:hypothetical protein
MHFTRMDQGTDADVAILRQVHEQNLRELPGRLIGLLNDLKSDTAYNITRYDHCLQTATRALRDGKDDEYVAVALLHDACERLGPFNHGEVIGSILKPFVSRDNLFMLTEHGLFPPGPVFVIIGYWPGWASKKRSSPARVGSAPSWPMSVRKARVPVRELRLTVARPAGARRAP